MKNRRPVRDPSNGAARFASSRDPRQGGVDIGPVRATSCSRATSSSRLTGAVSGGRHCAPLRVLDGLDVYLALHRCLSSGFWFGAALRNGSTGSVVERLRPGSRVLRRTGSREIDTCVHAAGCKEPPSRQRTRQEGANLPVMKALRARRGDRSGVGTVELHRKLRSVPLPPGLYDGLACQMAGCRVFIERGSVAVRIAACA